MGVLPAGRKARRLCLLLIALLLGGASVLAAVHVHAWYHYRAAQTALTHYHFAQARSHLVVPLRIWPNSWRVHLLAARAARLDGAAEEAREHLDFCQQKQPDAEEILLEWALLHACAGELTDVEGYLIDRLRRGPEQTALIQEALIEGYMRTYRIGPALAGVEDWLKRQPDDTQAWYLQGCIWQQVQRPQMALPGYRRALELDPQRDDARWRLSQCLLPLGLYEEATHHLEYLQRHYPHNIEMTVDLAGARFKQGQLAEARQTLDAVLAEHPDNEAALRERGRLALADEDAAAAEKWLRQAQKINPHDAKLFPLLSTALEQQGKKAEAHLYQEKTQQNFRDLQRLGRICLHELGEKPNDPVLHSELGVLLLRLGYTEAGRNWLLFALQEDRNCEPARAALEGTNQTEP